MGGGNVVVVRRTPAWGRLAYALLLILGGAVQANLYAQQPAAMPHAAPLIFDPHVLENIELLYHRFAPDEFLVCLLGESRGRFVYVTDFAMPPQKRFVLQMGNGQKQRSLSVAQDACKDYHALGTLHSHPPSDRDAFCYASHQDAVTFGWRTTDDYMAILCERGILYWGRAQIRPGELNMPISGQVVPMPEKWTP